MPKSSLSRGNRRGGSRLDGAISLRKALKLAKQVGIQVEHKRNSSLIRLTSPNGDSISISGLDKEITKNTAAWIKRYMKLANAS